MTLVLDSGGVSLLAGNRARLRELRRRDEWPPIVPSPVLTEALTGDHRRDFHEDILLRLCRIQAVDEALAREAAVLRTLAQDRGMASAVDAIVVAQADRVGGAVVLTSDARDLVGLSRHARSEIRISTG